MNLPPCFKNQAQYSDWLLMARQAKVACSICEDCTFKYRSKMKDEGRCHEVWFLSHMVMKGRDLPDNPPSFGKFKRT